MIGRYLTRCVLGAMALALTTQAANAFIRVPKHLLLPPVSTSMNMGPKTLAPFAYVRFCAAVPAECRKRGSRTRVLMSRYRWKQLTSVNVRVNRAIRPRYDRKIGVFADNWAVAPRYGDCEDFALTKRSELIAMGWPSGALSIATAYAPGIGGHAVLIVRTHRGDYVLDNLRRKIVPWKRTGYSWWKMQSPTNPRYWVDI